jgi:hypothetical protein
VGRFSSQSGQALAAIQVWPASMFQDLRLSVRAIAQSKATTAAILLSLALGTGVNAAVYGVAAARSG